MLGPRQPFAVNPKMHFGKTCRLLMKAFGSDGEKTAANMAIHGIEGGLRRVLKTLALGLAEEFSGNEIRGRVGVYWNSLSLEEKLAAPKEYLAKYGHLLPADVTECSAARVRGFFPKFLENHPETLRRLRHVGR